ncbi:hypothetical protein LX97_02398 [Nonlabens dokdonensis]|jgi:hypothetical protein|uniref:Uncharacterized protein n=2 Tax=Nonlabens dokdonensis TaxID=328515 RepID=L7W4Z4_NONDD|nr:hypothetical protein [Nonlabens dokdonensis]AGC75227.1 hypothetical protein DDD_0100 [Nonlabens dokdonensis DSW-6]PZX39032.1 hypothetical protein LX97_02398 [Nonlabens dokdonensis]
MSFGGSVQGMITAMKNNAALKKSRKKFKGLDGATGIYKKGTRKESFTPEQIQAAKDAFQIEVKREKRKTWLTLFLTLIAVPLVLWALVELYLFTFN